MYKKFRKVKEKNQMFVYGWIKKKKRAKCIKNLGKVITYGILLQIWNFQNACNICQGFMSNKYILFCSRARWKTPEF